MSAGANAWISSASGVRRGSPPTIRASYTSTTTAASSRAYRPTIAPGSTRMPVSSSVSRIAASVTLSSISMNPPGCAHLPRDGSMPRRRSSASPASVTGIVVTTSRGLT